MRVSGVRCTLAFFPKSELMACDGTNPHSWDCAKVQIGFRLLPASGSQTAVFPDDRFETDRSAAEFRAR